MTTSDSVQIRVRLPLKAKDWIERTAKRNERTKNSQVVFVIKQAMEKEKASEAYQANSDASHQ